MVRGGLYAKIRLMHGNWSPWFNCPACGAGYQWSLGSIGWSWLARIRCKTCGTRSETRMGWGPRILLSVYSTILFFIFSVPVIGTLAGGHWPAAVAAIALFLLLLMPPMMIFYARAFRKRVDETHVHPCYPA